VVRIKQFCFTPTVLRVPVGARVTFINLDPFAHTVLGANGAWGSYEPLVTGPPPTYVFRHAGVYPYACTIHPGMVGTIVAGRVPATKGLQTLSSSVEPVPELARAVTTAAADPKVPSPVGAPGWRMAAAAEALFILIVGAVAVERGRAKPGPHLP